jgi:hypothetical protein
LVGSVDGVAAGVRRRLCRLGEDVATLRLLLVALAVSGAPGALLKASARLKPPKVAARYSHLWPSLLGSSPQGQTSEAAPTGARLAVLGQVHFRPIGAVATAAAASAALREALEVLVGPVVRVEFVPADQADPPPTSSPPGPHAAAAAAAHHLAAGSWLVEFPPTAAGSASAVDKGVDESGPRRGRGGGGGDDDGADAEAGAAVAAAALGHGGGFKDLHTGDLPLGLKVTTPYPEGSRF